MKGETKTWKSRLEYECGSLDYSGFYYILLYSGFYIINLNFSLYSVGIVLMIWNGELT